MASETWESYLATLPAEPWDLFTDFGRDQVAGEARLGRLPIFPGRGAEEPEEVQDLLVAFWLALASCDRGRDEVWILDSTAADRAPPLPLRLRRAGGTLAELHGSFVAERRRLLALRDAEAAESALAALQRAAPAARFARLRAHPVCQAAIANSPPSPAGCASGCADFTLVLGSTPELVYRADLYEPSTAHFVARHVAALMKKWPAWSTTSVEDATVLMLDEEERGLVLDEWNDTAAAFDEEACIHQLFERSARGAAAERPAVVAADGSTWSYRQLDAASGEVAAVLCTVDCHDGDRVGLLVDRSPALIAAVYGILRAGLAYVPLDAEWPASRQAVIIEDVAAAVIVASEGLALPELASPVAVVRVTESIFASDSGTVGARLVSTGLAPRLQGPRVPQPSPQRSAYILYTSGTTGKPKGVDVPHYGLVGRTEWLQHVWPMDAADVMVQKTPATFAISEWELFWPLCYGARIVQAARKMHGDAQHVAQLMEQQGVTHSVFVPSLLDQLLDELDGRALPQLRLIIACGEALKSSLVKTCLQNLPCTELVNLYGPTEGTMTVLSFHRNPEPKHFLRFPIGTPMENTQIICAASGPPQLQPAPVLVQGELVFGGPLIATGYWGLPELTKEKFVDNPHGPGRVYRSGDLGRWRSDGTLEFLGRADSQVKFNGVRIELGEIEAAATALPEVRAAAAFLSPPHLVLACVLLAPGPDPEAERRQLLESLRASLPKDRVPTRLEVLPAMPTTDRGKLDRKKLLDEFFGAEAERARLAAEAAAARSPGSAAAEKLSDTEGVIEALMRDLLGVHEQLPATERFQDLGFSSLLLGKLTTHVRRRCGLPALAATAVYRAPTLRQLAALVDEEQRSETSSDVSMLQLATADEVWRGGSSTSLLSLTCTIFGLMVQSVVCELAFLPAYYGLWHVYFNFGIEGLCVAFAPVIALDVLLTLAVAVMLKWAILGQRREGTWPIYGLYYWKWWFVHEIEQYIMANLSQPISDTVLFNVFARAMGATIGAGARINMASLGDMDLIEIGAGARLEREALLVPARLVRGELHLRRIFIGAGACVGQRAHVPGGTAVPGGALLTPMASSDSSGAFHILPGKAGHLRASALLSFFQLVIGVPLLVIVEGLSMVPVTYCSNFLWDCLVQRLATDLLRPQFQTSRLTESGTLGTKRFKEHYRGYTLAGKQKVLYPFLLSLPWIWSFVHGGAYFLIVVIVKWALIGRFEAGVVRNDWDVFRRWLLERLTTSRTYSHFMELWVNTEILSVCYRLLGARIEPRVNMDYFGAVEFDLITVERDVVFGSSVVLVTTVNGISRPVEVQRGACVLDRCVVLPGVTIPEGTLLGSTTVAPSDHRLMPMTVYMGNEGGMPVELFRRALLPGEYISGTRVVSSDGSPATSASGGSVSGSSVNSLSVQSPAALRQRELEGQALARHRSTFWFVVFNLWCVFSAVLFAPLLDVVYWVTVVFDFEIYDYFLDSDWGEVVSVCMIVPIYILVLLSMLSVLCALKWALIGRWTVGDRPYYTWFHFRWASLMVAFVSLGEVIELVSGTWLAVVFMRAMGAKVGNRVCFFGHGFEFDLLHIGDDVCIGPLCDVTAHTVENMVMKMERVRFEDGASSMAGAIVMPGAQMEPWSLLIEHSQVLKGDVVLRGTAFGGLPAKPLQNYSMPPPRAEVERLPSEAAGPARGQAWLEMGELGTRSQVGGAERPLQPLLSGGAEGSPPASRWFRRSLIWRPSEGFFRVHRAKRDALPQAEYHRGLG